MLGLGLGLSRSSFVAESLLLDTYSGAAAAYSLRKLSSDYTGAAIRVRESATNTEADIGFNPDGTLDTTSLLSHTGANDGFVVTWYDQAGSNNVTQSTAANQPQIVSSGSVITTGGKPCVRFTKASSHSLLKTSGIGWTGASARVLMAVYRPTSAAGSVVQPIAGVSGSSATGTWYMMQARNQSVQGDPYLAGFSADAGAGLTTLTTDRKLGWANYTGTVIQLYKNGGLVVNQARTLNTNSLYNFYIGSDVSNFGDLEIQEIIAYPSDQSANRTGIETNINAYYNIYP